MVIDISNGFTREGMLANYRAIFDPTNTYNESLMQNSTTFIKLELVDDNGNSIYSNDVDNTEIGNEVLINYHFSLDREFNLSKLRLRNSNNITMVELDNLNYHLYPNTSTSGTGIDELNSVSLSYKVVFDNSTTYVDSEWFSHLVGVRDPQDYASHKLTHLYLGQGEPDLSGNSDHLTTPVSYIHLDDENPVTIDSCTDGELVVFINLDQVHNITELGLGQGTSLSNYGLFIINKCNIDINSPNLSAIISINILSRGDADE